ncbi:alpha/beta hydrolase [Alteraurantiacibacter aquimixticola]|uniref:Alpha/beta hydrolase n=1 Tax=Alteraurantiacibacter aquimixticola TaxID=2489173 RepID=A0A4T3EZ89_9SPHN|nr:alpha/beta hydrolase-fold protein [Alteraurantiacibacter aquimixticola]TIX49189.1 alpha/beta hydrolase [Alteraurantiacibacter aquimixticola]
MISRLASKIAFFAAATALFGASPVDARNAGRSEGSIAHLPALSGDYFALSSEEVGRDYHIYVRLPEGYDENSDYRYPVVYLLDGDSTFPLLAPLHLFMHYDDEIPEAIIVGIAYGGFEPGVNMRHVDFRMVMDDGSPGGAPQFLSMLENELLPTIDREFRTDPLRRIIVGQSRGGSAVLQAAWLKPDLFWGHVASNPGREPDTRLLFGMDRDPPEKVRSGYVIVASGSRDRDYLRGTALEWRDQIAARDDLPWDTRFIDIEGGTHAADLGTAYRAALRMLFLQAETESTDLTD